MEYTYILYRYIEENNMARTYFVYIMTNERNGTLYIGITNDIGRRDYEHKFEPKGFVARYKLNILVYIREFDDVSDAINHEKELKKWKRAWKIQLIEKHNPDWVNLGSS